MKRSAPTLLLAAGLGLLYPMQRWIDSATPREVVGEETLYLSSGEAIKRMSPGVHGLVAGIYWIRTVQYFGRKLIDSGQPPSSSSSRNIRMDLLAPLLNIVVTLDPQHMPAYRFGAIFLPERDLPAAISLLERGVRENPDAWRLYQDLGYIYWQAGKDAAGPEQANYYAKAAEWYERGGAVEGSAWWMRDLAGLMRLRAGSWEAARVIYSGYLTSDDQMIRAQAVERLKQLRAEDEKDALNELLGAYKSQRGACPAGLNELAPALRARGFTLDDRLMPLDPAGFPYALDRQSCLAKLSDDSTIPR